MDEQPGIAWIERGDGLRLAYRLRAGRAPTLVFLPGYASDMEGAKAVALDAFAARRGVGLLRFDYSGTGSSAGSFEEGTLELWLGEAERIVERLTDGPLVLVGSSMGGWLALVLAEKLRDRVVAVLGIAAAPDFTEWGFDAAQKEELRTSGRIVRENPYGGDGQLTTFAFWESGQRLRLLERSIEVDCPVRLIHGEKDGDVPVEVAFRTMRALRSADVQLNVLKGGGHRLSEPHEIATILRTVDALLEPA